MKRIAPLLLCLAALAATPAMAQKVYVDFDKNYDFDAIKTFAYFDTKEATLADVAPMAHSRIVQMLRDRMTAGGLQEVETDPDVYITYHGSVSKEMGVDTISTGYYGYGPGWGWNPYWGWGGSVGVGATTSRTYTYDVGTLIVDIWDPETEQLIWRGTTENTIRENPDKNFKTIESALYKMGKKFNKEYRKVKKQRGK